MHGARAISAARRYRLRTRGTNVEAMTDIPERPRGADRYRRHVAAARAPTRKPVTAIRTTHPTPRSPLTDRRFVRHYLEMLAAMIVGMVVLGPLSMLLGDGVGVEVHALLIHAYMTAGMAAWMTYRRHHWLAITEMGLAMGAAFVVLFPPHWAGLLAADTLFVIGHVLMLPAMALAMLRRREEYLGHGDGDQHRLGLQQPARGVDADLLDVPARGDAQDAGELAGEMPRAHPDPLGQPRHPQVGGGIGVHEVLRGRAVSWTPSPQALRWLGARPRCGGAFALLGRASPTHRLRDRPSRVGQRRWELARCECAWRICLKNVGLQLSRARLRLLGGWGLFRHLLDRLRANVADHAGPAAGTASTDPPLPARTHGEPCEDD